MQQYQRLSQQELRKLELVERKHQMHIRTLYKELANASPKEKKAIRKKIDKAVEDYNHWHPKAPNYYDLHWMSVVGALDYVQRIVESTSRRNKVTLFFETGMGNHSNHGVPIIKRELKSKYENKDGFSIEEDRRNHGVLKLVLKAL